MTHALELREVTKRYVGHLAVDRLSLTVPRGSIYGILGPNGAGKSTTLRMVMNILARDSGAISVLGSDPAAERAVLRRVLGEAADRLATSGFARTATGGRGQRP